MPLRGCALARCCPCLSADSRHSRLLVCKLPRVWEGPRQQLLLLLLLLRPRLCIRPCQGGSPQPQLLYPLLDSIVALQSHTMCVWQHDCCRGWG